MLLIRKLRNLMKFELDLILTISVYYRVLAWKGHLREDFKRVDKNEINCCTHCNFCGSCL